MSTVAIVALLNEVEAAVYDIRDANFAAWTQQCCDNIRDAIAANDAVAAALAGCHLGERLADIRKIAQTALPSSPPRLERARKKAVERCEEYWAARARGYSDHDACKQAAEKLGVDTKTIRRAQRFINPE